MSTTALDTKQDMLGKSRTCDCRQEVVWQLRERGVSCGDCSVIVDAAGVDLAETAVDFATKAQQVLTARCAITSRTKLRNRIGYLNLRLLLVGAVYNAGPLTAREMRLVLRNAGLELPGCVKDELLFGFLAAVYTASGDGDHPTARRLAAKRR